MKRRNGVLVTRPAAEAVETAGRLAELGWTAVIAPMLTIRPLPLVPPDGLAAIAVTSGNAIAALPAQLRHLPLFAVGDATAERARAAGFAARSAGADATALAALILAEAPPGPILLAVGAGRGEALAARLRQAGRMVFCQTAYAADPVSILPGSVATALQAGGLAAALFFSAETARVFMSRIAEAGLLTALAPLYACAIGPAAAMALRAAPWHEVRVASHPTQEALLAQLP
ncbi:MAG: uroporphyrinogen-III synthase [Acetobacteraceae bacterium]